MTLRTRLLVGYLVFILALAVLGGWSAWRLNRMGVLTGRIVADNYDSVVAAQDMKESLERQDSAALFELLDRRDRAAPQLAEHRRRFDAAFQRAAGNVTEPGEGDILEAIRRGRDDYYQRFDRFMPILPGPGRADAYFTDLEPQFNRVRADCDRLLRLNQEGIRQKTNEAVAVARQWFLTTLAVAAGLVIAGVALALALARDIVGPIQTLTLAAKRIAGGDLSTSVQVERGDEIGVLSGAFNSMAQRLREVRLSDLGQVLLERQTTEATIDSLYDPVIVTDEEGRVTKINPAGERLFGAEAEVLGKSIIEVAPDSRIAAAVFEVLESQRAVAQEDAASVVPLAAGEREERAFHVRSTPVWRDGRLLGAVTLLEDVTRLREIDRLQSEFIASASHELRTPLTSVQMGIHMLLEQAAGELNDKQLEILSICRDDAARLEKLMRDLLDLSKIESGEAAPRLARVGSSSLIRDAVEPLRPQVEAKGVELHVDAPLDLGPVMADRAQIERVVGTLITNAVAATSRGGSITVSGVRRGDHLSVTVADSGRGIPREYLAGIFEPFVQVPGAPTGHAGVGLAIARRIVEAHGGQISIQSEVGRGTSVTFTIPVAGADGHRQANHVPVSQQTAERQV
jgi:NtrC-family two-component system sensor histidine kinase KinB